MTPKSILDHVTATYPEIEIRHDGDETILLYNPGGLLTTGLPFLSITRGDQTWRLSIVQPEQLYVARFGSLPKLLENGAFVAGDWNYEEQDVVTPDPRRAPWGWISVVNPSQRTFDDLKPHIAAGLQQAMAGAKSKLDFERRPTPTRKH